MKESCLKGCFCSKAAFTLIELLVVVLIIGILAAVAVPQYQKAVEKSRVAEAFTTLDTLKKAIDVYVLEHGLQSVTFIGLPDKQRPQAQLDIDIPLDCDEDGICNFGKYYRYLAACTSSYCYANAASKELSDSSIYGLSLTLQDGTWGKTCFYDGEKAEQICNSLSGLGWESQEN